MTQYEISFMAGNVSFIEICSALLTQWAGEWWLRRRVRSCKISNCHGVTEITLHLIIQTRHSHSFPQPVPSVSPPTPARQHQPPSGHQLNTKLWGRYLTDIFRSDQGRAGISEQGFTTTTSSLLVTVAVRLLFTWRQVGGKLRAQHDQWLRHRGQNETEDQWESCGVF